MQADRDEQIGWMILEEAVLYGIGVGPGDEGLLTVKAAEILAHVPVVCAPSDNRGNPGLAYDIAKGYLNPSAEVLLLDFPMEKDPALLRAFHQKGARTILSKLKEGRSAAFITLGDCGVYSTFSYICSEVRAEGFPVRIVPGIPSFCAGAAAALWSLAEGNQKIAILPGITDIGQLHTALATFETVVLMKAYRCFEEIKAFLQETGRLPATLLVRRVGQPGEEILTGDAILNLQKADYFTTLIIRKGEG